MADDGRFYEADTSKLIAERRLVIHVLRAVRRPEDCEQMLSYVRCCYNEELGPMTMHIIVHDEVGPPSAMSDIISPAREFSSRHRDENKRNLHRTVIEFPPDKAFVRMVLNTLRIFFATDVRFTNSRRDSLQALGW